MNELQVETLKLSPAVIEFNHKDIEKELQENLAKYEGLTFTSDATSEIRSTLAELRKGKKAVDDYRKAVKKELNEPVKEFESKCKELDRYFEDVITPLDSQLKTFVERERAEKLAKLEDAKKEYISIHGLNDEYVERIEIEDRFLTKSVSLKVASESIEFQVKNLKMEQDKLESDKEVITTTIKLVNAENDMSFSIDAYLRLLEFDSVDYIKKQIENDVKKEVSRREEQAKAEQERKEKEEKERAERERIEKKRVEEAERERVEKEQQEKEVVAQEKNEEPIAEDEPYIQVIANENGEIIGVPTEDIEKDPFESMDDPFASEEVVKIYEVVGTDEEHEALEMYLNRIGLEWNVNE